MEKESILTIISEMKASGIDFMLADTDVKLYECGVQCGTPNVFFDDVASSMKLPEAFFRNKACFVIYASGNSMTGAGISDGDQLLVEFVSDVRDGDVVVAMLDGEFTIKTFFRDEFDRCWLLPQNEAYMPIQIKEGCDFRLCGRVIKVMKENISISYSDCKKILRKSNIANAESKELTHAKVKKAIESIRCEIAVSRQWYSVFRVLVDRGFYGSVESIGTFVDDVNKMFPNNNFRLNADDLARMAVQSFRRPVAMWNHSDAPVQGKRFDDYLRIAMAFNKELT